MKNFYYLLTICLVLSFSNVQAQYEVGTSLGGALYFGELSPSLGENIKNANLSFGIFARYNFDEKLSFRLHWQQNILHGADSLFKDNPGLVNRNLSFRNVLDEIAVLTEYNFYSKSFGFDSKVSVYGMAGIALFLHNPKATLDGTEYELQPLGTGGQGLPNNDDFYKLTQISIPFGFGVKVALKKNISVGLDLLERVTFTDYIDDVSGNYPDFDALEADRGAVAVGLSNRNVDGTIPNGRRGNPKTDDWYSSVTLTVSYTFGNESEKVNKRKSDKQR